MEAGFVSHLDTVLTLFWINPISGAKINSGTLKYGERNTVWTSTRLGHKFELIDEFTNELMGAYTIQHDSFFVIGKSKSRLYDRDVVRLVEETFKGEWERSRRIKRTFTELGFTLGKLPPDLWGSMSAYYYNNRENKVDEEWASKGIPDQYHLQYVCISSAFHLLHLFHVLYFSPLLLLLFEAHN